MPTSLLLDTNAYYEFFKRADHRKPQFAQMETLLTIENGIKSFYISEITSMEIHSVVGQYARGKNKSIEVCTRKVIDSQNQEQTCTQRWISPFIKSLNINKLAILLLQIDHAERQIGDIHANILPITTEAIHEGKRLLRKYATKFALGSHDAFIAGFLIAANKQGKNLSLITFDKALKNVLKLENQPIIEFL